MNTGNVIQGNWTRIVDDGAIESVATAEQDIAASKKTAYDSAMTDLTRQEMDAKLAASEAKVDARLANFDTSVKTGFAELRTEFAELRAEISHGRTDAMKQSSDNLKWLIGAVAGMLSLAVAAIGLMINWSKAPAAPAAQPAPIVVYAQPAPPVGAPATVPSAQK